MVIQGFAGFKTMKDKPASSHCRDLDTPIDTDIFNFDLNTDIPAVVHHHSQAVRSR
jgi:hypothetical protein